MARVTACSTLGFCNFPLDVAATQIAATGFTNIELCHLGVYCLHFTIGKDDPKAVRGLFDRLGLTPVAMNFSTCWSKDGQKVSPNLALADHAKLVERNVKRLLSDLAVIGVPLLNISVGRRTETADRRQRVEKSAAVVNRLGEFAAELGIRLTLEVPHCFDLHNNVERVAEMFSLIESPNIGALLDSSHWTVLNYDLDALWQAVGGRLWHVHLRDARGGDTADFNQQLEFTAGRGQCDFAALALWLDRHDYQGDVSLEFEYRDPLWTLPAIQAEYDFGLRCLAKSGWSLTYGGPDRHDCRHDICLGDRRDEPLQSRAADAPNNATYRRQVSVP